MLCERSEPLAQRQPQGSGIPQNIMAAMTIPLAAKPFSAARVAARPTQQRGLRLAVAASSQKLSPVQTAVSSLR